MSLSSNSGSLDDDTKNEDRNVDQDSVFSGKNFGKESRIHGTQPSAQFENSNEPALLRGVPVQRFLVRDVIAHVCMR